MGTLSWDRPKKIRRIKAHNTMFSADGTPPGVYTPNMSEADNKKWKAKLIGGEDPSIEIRVCLHSQIKIIVRLDNITMSMNGPSIFNNQDWMDLYKAVEEARTVLFLKTNATKYD